jgi:microsomal dipeptidase-like Zn-dependent dipeptidase
MRLTLRLAAFVAAALIALVLVFGPGWFEAGANGVSPTNLKISPHAAALHRRLVVADLHADTLLFSRDPLARASRGHVDVPRLREGNVALQVFSSVTKSPRGLNYDRNPSNSDTIWLLSIAQLQPPRTWGSLLERSLWHAEKLQRAAARDRNLRIIRTRADLERGLADRAAGQPVTLALLSIEGLHDMEGRFENLDRLYAAGFRMAGLAHLFDSELAGSTAGEAKGGLTPIGRRTVAAMEAKGMVVDLAHVSHAAIADTLALATKPVIQSHGGVKGTCNNNRTLSDEEVRGIARTGGVIGIGLWDQAVCAATPQATAKAMAYVKRLVGPQAVALGSDWDGAVTTWTDASGIAALTQALIDEGFSDEEIAAAMGGNVMRVLNATLPPG